MSVVLARVDDRLIHGQVVIGWGRPLDVQFIALVDDDVAGNDWEQELYRMAVPTDVDVEFATVDEAVARLPEWRARPGAGLLLTGDVGPMVELLTRAPGHLPAVNLGGIHHRPGRRERTSYVYLTDAEYALLSDAAAGGVRVTAQDVPSSDPIPLEALA